MTTKSEIKKLEAQIKELKKTEQKPEYILMDKILEKYELISILGVVMTKDGNSYVPYETQLRKFILDELQGENISSTIKNRVIDNIKDKTATEDEEFFTHEDWIIPFSNGYYEAKNGGFKTLWQDDKKFFYEIPHNYNKDFKGTLMDDGTYKMCPIFTAALKEYLIAQKNVNLCKVDDIFEIMGYLMTMNTNLRKCFYIFGPTRTGKTTVQTIILHIIGNKNISNISLWRMQKNEFGTDGLQLKILNTVSETHGGKLTDISYIKQITGADKFIAVEPKGEKKGRFINAVKLLYLGNTLPWVDKTHWNDHAFYDRWILINFAQTFKVTREKYSDFIINSPDEIQGIIHECLKGLKGLFDRGDFRPELIENSEHIWKYNSDSFYRFVHDKCEFKWGESIGRGDLFRDYVKYVFDNDLGIPISNKAITWELRKYNILQISHFEGRKQVFEYDGIKFKSDEQVVAEKIQDEVTVKEAIGPIDKSYKQNYEEWEAAQYAEQQFLDERESSEDTEQEYWSKKAPKDVPEAPDPDEDDYYNESDKPEDV